MQQTTRITERLAPDTSPTPLREYLAAYGLRAVLFAVALAVAFALVVAHAATGEPKLLGLAVLATVAMIVAWGIQE